MDAAKVIAGSAEHLVLSELQQDPSGGEIHTEAGILKEVASEEDVMGLWKRRKPRNVVRMFDVLEPNPDAVEVSEDWIASRFMDFATVDAVEVQPISEARADTSSGGTCVDLGEGLERRTVVQTSWRYLDLDARSVFDDVLQCLAERNLMPFRLVVHCLRPPATER